MKSIKKPIIGVIARTDVDEDGDYLLCIYEKVRRAIIKKGGIPFLIMPIQDINYDEITPGQIPRLTEEEKQDLYSQVDLCDGIFIPGGYKWYEFDAVIYRYAFNKNMPILGLCAGMQMMARVDNDITLNIIEKNTTLLNHHKRRVKYVHSVNIDENTKLFDIVKKKTIQVNSKHNFHIIKTGKFKISAYSDDGLIEGIEHPDKDFVIGLQWHPETMLAYDDSANKIFDSFIEKCVEYN